MSELCNVTVEQVPLCPKCKEVKLAVGTNELFAKCSCPDTYPATNFSWWRERCAKLLTPPLSCVCGGEVKYLNHIRSCYCTKCERAGATGKTEAEACTLWQRDQARLSLDVDKVAEEIQKKLHANPCSWTTRECVRKVLKETLHE